ncbi:sulfotransferase family protein [Psychroserpens damuponensis]|uniref:sulfotransferase family protein n=1 Tax=Psychroserpens damuponensis TaxID=943936 RepID=UPI00058AF892|nr:sulfotransferase [Psychroserpens damuponensis]
MNKKLPDFLIVGAAKCGTTSLGDYLNEHKNMFICNPKEPKYLTYSFLENAYKGKGDDFTKKKAIKTLEGYKDLFKKAKDNQYKGESSVDLLYYYDQSIPVIKEVLGDPKIIIMLRNPSKRAFSAYGHLIRDGRENLSFIEGLEKEDERMKLDYEFIWAYKNASFYADSTKAFLENFTNVKVIIFEEFVKNQEEITNEVLEFLGVKNESNNFSEVHRNISGKPKSQLLNTLLLKDSFVKSILKALLPSSFRARVKYVIQKNNLKPLETKQDEANYLNGVFDNDIDKLQEILQKDLSFWKQ